MALLEVRDIVVHYRKTAAVRGISLDVPEGEIVTLIAIILESLIISFTLMIILKLLH